MQNLAPTDSDYELIAKLVYKHSRIHLGDGKRELVSSRLGKRLRALGCSSYSEYCGILTRPGAEEELAELVDAISTNHTFFFREQQHFDFLEKTVFPPRWVFPLLERGGFHRGGTLFHRLDARGTRR